MVDAVRCDCGYCFDPDALGGNDATEYAEEQDRLYLDYLAARVVQAEAEMIVAREQANADSSNTYKSAAALVAEQALSTVQAEMSQLSARVRARPVRPAAAKPAARVSRPAFTPNAPSHKTQAKANNSGERKHEAARFAAPKPSSSTKHGRSQDAIFPESEKTAIAKPFSKPHVLAKSVETKPRATTYTAKATSTRHDGESKSTSIPNSSFRSLQSRKAAAIARAQPIAPAPTLDDTLGAPAKRPEPMPHSDTPVFRGQSKATTQDCPSCGATLALDATRCRCGYLFKHVTDMPALASEAPIAFAPLDREGMQECPNCTATVSAHVTRCNCGYTFSYATEQVPALSLDATALSILSDGVGRTSRRR